MLLQSILVCLRVRGSKLENCRFNERHQSANPQRIAICARQLTVMMLRKEPSCIRVAMTCFGVMLPSQPDMFTVALGENSCKCFL